jgi:hypothetical protein
MKKKKSIDTSIISRIEEMEVAFDKIVGIVRRLREDLDSFNGAGEEISKLENYLSSGDWLKDFEADEAGLIPEGIKRGVLSEDGLYDLLHEIDSLRSTINTD